MAKLIATAHESVRVCRGEAAVCGEQTPTNRKLPPPRRTVVSRFATRPLVKFLASCPVHSVLDVMGIGGVALSPWCVQSLPGDYCVFRFGLVRDLLVGCTTNAWYVAPLKRMV